VVQNFNKGGTDWAHGNFLYGASTNFNDLVQVVQNFNKVLPAPSGSAIESGGRAFQLFSASDAQYNSTSVDLPEPTFVGWVTAGALGLLSQRKRRQIRMR
jgi:hypothetical protein